MEKGSRALGSALTHPTPAIPQDLGLSLVPLCLSPGLRSLAPSGGSMSNKSC